MSGGRYTDWSHIHVPDGDVEAAARYVPDARKLLGFVIDEAKRNGLGVHQVSRQLDDGTVLVAEKHGDIPRMTIIPAKPKVETQLVFPPHDFVVWARDATLPAGIDAEYPQQILRASEDPRTSSSFGGISVSGAGAPRWKTFFYDDSTTGYEDFPGNKGTYLPAFPEGIPRAGNVDWRDKAGARVSWHGPSLRYWFDRWRNASAQYGPHVFLLGRVLLDIDAYCTAAEVDMQERMVLGACVRGQRLYVMQAHIPDQHAAGSTYPPSALPGDVYVTPPWSADAIVLRLMRYSITVNPALEAAARWSIATGSHEELWTGSGQGWLNPWFFNQQGTVAESVAMPAQPLFTCYQDPDAPARYTFDAPSATNALLRIGLAEDDSATFSSVSTTMQVYSAGVHEAVIAVDYNEKGERVELYFGYDAPASPEPWPEPPGGNYDPAFWGEASFCTYFLRQDQHRIVVEDVISGNGMRWGHLIGADIRTGAYVLSCMAGSPTAWLFTPSVEVYSGGVLQHQHEFPTFENVNGAAPYSAQWHYWAAAGGITAIAPLLFLVGITAYGGSPLNRPISPGGFVQNGYFDDTGFSFSGWVCADNAQRWGIKMMYGRLGLPSGVYTDNATLGDPAGYQNQPEDFNGYADWSGMASNKELVLFSGAFYQPTAYAASDLAVFNYATRSDLGELTGVDGDQARYHPIWRLGKPLNF